RRGAIELRYDTSGAVLIVFFFFQAEDGIRDATVTGVQTCALPILFGDLSNSTGLSTKGVAVSAGAGALFWHDVTNSAGSLFRVEIGRASCREKSVDGGGRGGIRGEERIIQMGDTCERDAGRGQRAP